MRAKRPQDKSRRTSTTAIFGTVPHLGNAHAALMARVFGLRSAMNSTDPLWTQIAVFEPDGRCVAALDVTMMPIVIGAVRHDVGAIRRVAVDEDRRGRGLFRQLMEDAHRWFDGRGASLVLLYAEDPGLYERFGYRTIPQHSFLGPLPPPTAAAPSRGVERDPRPDFVRRMIAVRTPLSHLCGVCGAADLFLDHLAATPELSLVYHAPFDALFATEMDDDGCVLVDIVAAKIPSMGDIAAALGIGSPTIRTLFPPDLLSWRAEPEPEDTGLMVRGVLPDALGRPFMLPPTAEF